MILRRLPGPLLGWLGILMFLFLMQFLMKYLPDLVGKGLPAGVVVELIAYNLAYMLVLAVPMSALLATLMVFGGLAETNAYLVIKSAGISLIQLIWPTLFAGLMLAGGMTYFNNTILPESNFRAKNLWRDIRQSKPGFDLQTGVFYEGIDRYSILVRERPPDSDTLRDVTIFDYSEGNRRQRVIKAQRGLLESRQQGNELEITLFEGEVHQREAAGFGKAALEDERYERLLFDRYRMRLDLSDLFFERNDARESYRSDRTTPTADMISFVDSLDRRILDERGELEALTMPLLETTAPIDSASFASLPGHPSSVSLEDAAPHPATRSALDGLNRSAQDAAFQTALARARSIRAKISEIERTVRWEADRADQYRVEIHKKFSIAIACLLFTLIGAPLGLSIGRRGGLGLIGATAMGIFIFYWITLVQGEKLADRGLLEPWVGMWIANVCMIAVGLVLFVYVTRDLRAVPTWWSTLWDRLLTFIRPSSPRS